MHVAAAITEEDMIERLRAGDAACFARVVADLTGMLRRVARGYLKEEALVEEVVQDTWESVVRAIDRFEGRSSFRTWVCSILVNRALTIAKRDARMPRVAVDDATEHDAAAFDAEGSWACPPRSWGTGSPANLAANKQVMEHVSRALEQLPPRQREVVTLRDVYGWTSAEVCEALGLSEINQRVLLHRGRAGMRELLDVALASQLAAT